MDKQRRLERVQEIEKGWNYWTHLWVNWRVAGLYMILFILHVIHGVLPFSWTEHERYISGDDF